LVITNKTSIDDIQNWPRCVTNLRIKDHGFNENSSAAILTLITSNAQTLKEVSLYKSTISAGQLWQILSLIPNVEALIVSETEIRDLAELLPALPHKFKKLKSLSIICHPDCVNFCAHVFQDVTTLVKLETNMNFTMISQQQNLKKLNVQASRSPFDALPDIKELQVLEFGIDKNFGHTKESSMLNLEAFVKTQNKIKSFSMFEYSYWHYNAVYQRIMTHVFRLESLRSVTTNYTNPTNPTADFIDFTNDHVKKLSFISNDTALRAEFPKYLRIFPKITSLEIFLRNRFIFDENIRLINQLSFLEELKIVEPYCNTYIMEDIQVRNLRKFEFESKGLFDPDMVYDFKRRHPKLTEIKLTRQKFRNP
jgi:hypothetical protein